MRCLGPQGVRERFQSMCVGLRCVRGSPIIVHLSYELAMFDIDSSLGHRLPTELNSFQIDRSAPKLRAVRCCGWVVGAASGSCSTSKDVRDQSRIRSSK